VGLIFLELRALDYSEEVIMKKLFYTQILFYLCLFSFIYPNNVPFKLGVENIPKSLLTTTCPNKKPEDCKIGLITNQTGVDQKGTRTADIFAQKGYTIQYIFAPEHGLNGTLAERDVLDAVDAKTNIPILSLYGNGSGKMIAPEHINNLDLLVFDIQDSGMRHYTYISTLLNTIKIAAEHNKPYIVLDRPNPLGSRMAGPLVEPSLISFISIAPIPLRHGMTIGEIALYFNKHVLEKSAQLQVIRMENYDRTVGFMGNFIHQLSPNLQSLQSCYGYSFLGLVGEVEPFDVGVGTPMAFRCIALPKSMRVPKNVWKKVQALFKEYGVKSVFYKHTNPKNKKKSKGLRLEFNNISQLKSFELFIALLQLFKQENISFSFSAAFNKAVGTAKVQEVIGGTLGKDLFFTQINAELEEFYKRAEGLFLYAPVPIFH
jgi:uncharacterized protein YbbC (DUF1343 family)